MADKTVGMLENVPSIHDESLIPVEQSGELMHASGKQFREFAENCVTPYSNAARADAALAEAARNDAQNAKTAAQSALTGVQNAIKNIPAGSTPIVNDLTTGGAKMALSAEQGKVLRQTISALTAADVGALAENAPLATDLHAVTKNTLVRTGGNTLNTPHKAGLTNFVSGCCWVSYVSSTYASLLYISGGKREVFVQECNNGKWSDWQKIATTDTALMRDGSNAMTGILSFNSKAYIQQSGGSLYISAHNVSDTENQRMVRIGSPAEVPNLNEALLFYDVVNGAPTPYPILHTGNKPIGSYTGNGSAAARTIATGGSGRWVAIDAAVNGVVAIVSAYGGAVYKVGDTIGTLSPTQAYFRNGVLTIATSTAINTNGAPYAYQVL